MASYSISQVQNLQEMLNALDGKMVSSNNDLMQKIAQQDKVIETLKTDVIADMLTRTQNELREIKRVQKETTDMNEASLQKVKEQIDAEFISGGRVANVEEYAQQELRDHQNSC